MTCDLCVCVSVVQELALASLQQESKQLNKQVSQLEGKAESRSVKLWVCCVGN